MLIRPVRRAARGGLVGTAARTAVVAGTATAVVGGVSHKQQAKAEQAQNAAAAQAEQQQAAAAPPPAPAPAPPPAAAPGPDRMTQLKELGDLKAQGILTEAEFEAEKAKILAS